jgi:hypothetical protein
VNRVRSDGSSSKAEMALSPMGPQTHQEAEVTPTVALPDTRPR